MNNLSENILIATPDELNILFPDFNQREVFCKIMERFINVIEQRSSIYGLQLNV